MFTAWFAELHSAGRFFRSCTARRTTPSAVPTSLRLSLFLHRTFASRLSSFSPAVPVQDIRHQKAHRKNQQKPIMSSGEQKELHACDVDDLILLEYSSSSSDEECTPPVPAPLEATQGKQADAHDLNTLSAFEYDSSFDDENVETESCCRDVESESRAQIWSLSNCVDLDSDSTDPPVQLGNAAGQDEELRASAHQSPLPNVTPPDSTCATWNPVLIDFDDGQNPVKPRTPPQHACAAWNLVLIDFGDGQNPVKPRTPPQHAGSESDSDGLGSDTSTSGTSSSKGSSSDASNSDSSNSDGSASDASDSDSSNSDGSASDASDSDSSNSDGSASDGPTSDRLLEPVASSPKSAEGAAPGPTGVGSPDVDFAGDGQCEQESESPRFEWAEVVRMASLDDDTDLSARLLQQILQDEVLPSPAAPRLPMEISRVRRPKPCRCQLQAGRSRCSERIAALEAACDRHTEALRTLNTMCSRLSESVIAMENEIRGSSVLLRRVSQLEQLMDQLHLCISAMGR